MGGDNAPDMVVNGTAMAQARHPRAKFLLFGDESRLAPLLAQHPNLAAAVEIRHTDQAVSSEDKPSQALRRGRETSMRLAINAVRDGEAGGVVSAGNTGALMAMAKVVLKTLPGISRPGLASVLPTATGSCVMLDLGANVESDENNLVQFAVMGMDFARAALGLERPRLGLLNVGAEELKGHDIVKAAADLLRSDDVASLPMEFHGFIEGDDIGKGTVDVVVTDGFTGNIALKAAEGTSRMFSGFLRQALKGSMMGRLGYLLARRAFRSIGDKMDPRRYNGAVFLGVNGVVVKSHGGTDEVGFANAVCVTIDLVADDVTEHIVDDFKYFSEHVDVEQQAAAS